MGEYVAAFFEDLYSNVGVFFLVNINKVKTSLGASEVFNIIKKNEKQKTVKLQKVLNKLGRL